MSESEEMAAFFKERGFGVPLGFGDSPALLVIDLLRGFTDPAMPLGANLDSQVAETVRLLGAAREAEIPVYYTTVWYEEKDLRDGGVWVKKQWKGASTLKAGTPAVELDPRLGRRPTSPSSSRSMPRPSSAPTSSRASTRGGWTPSSSPVARRAGACGRPPSTPCSTAFGPWSSSRRSATEPGPPTTRVCSI
jgi:Isochorismatase family